MDRLPEDVLAGILGRLDPGSLAACRCVSKDLRRAIGDGRFLQLPRWLHGIFFNYNDHPHPHLLSRPQPAAISIDGAFRFMAGDAACGWLRDTTIRDHCNGMFLYDNDDGTYDVCNPVTRRRRRLPPRMEKFDYAAAHLVFDPATSLDYEVVLLPWAPGTAPYWCRPPLGWLLPEKVDPLMEWPPAVLEIDVFSSRTETDRWEVRKFVRVGGAAVTIADVLSEDAERPRTRYGRYAEYWKGALYVHCRGSFVLRLSLSDNSYEATKTPVFVKENENKNTSLNEDEDVFEDDHGSVEDYLGKSEKGIYYVTLHKLQIWVWSLDESGQLMEWVLQHHSNLSLLCKTPLSNYVPYFNTPWVIADCYSDSSDDEVCDSESDDDEELGHSHQEYSNLNIQDLIYTNSEEDNKNDGPDDDCDGEENGQKDQGKNCGVEENNEEHTNSQESSDDRDNGDSEQDEDDEKYSEWNSDDDYTLERKYSSEYDDDDYTIEWSDFYFLGFHPYKEVIFLANSDRVVAYHLGRCKAEYLGRRGPRGFGLLHAAAYLESFPYTPCFIDALPNSRDF